jgi:hypothetical protein
VLSGCAHAPSTTRTVLTAETLDILFCAAADEKLSLPARDLEAAKAYLDDLLTRMKANDPEATREAADLIARVQECLQ